jgi:hypothetical protein
MRNVLPFALLLGLAACATTSHWEKPGADETAAGRDNVECRRAAQQEASRFTPTPFYGGPFMSWRRPSYFMWQSNFELDRFYTENRLAAFCMRSRGYELVTVQPPQTQAPQTPPPPATEK